MDRVKERLIELSDILDEFCTGHDADKIGQNLMLFSFLSECFSQKAFVYKQPPSKEKHPEFSLFFNNMRDFFSSYQLTKTEQSSFFSELRALVKSKPNLEYNKFN